MPQSRVAPDSPKLETTHFKALRRPWLWLGLWWLAIVLVVVVCLLPGQDLPKMPGGFDKVEHLVTFALLASAAVQLYATRRALVMAALGLVALGIAIEFAQGSLTSTRSMDAWDAVADACGVLLGMASVWTPWRNVLLRLDAWLWPR